MWPIGEYFGRLRQDRRYIKRLENGIGLVIRWNTVGIHDGCRVPVYTKHDLPFVYVAVRQSAAKAICLECDNHWESSMPKFEPTAIFDPLQKRVDSGILIKPRIGSPTPPASYSPRSRRAELGHTSRVWHRC